MAEQKDLELARAVHAATTALNVAIQAAHEAGLKVEMDTRTMTAFGYQPYPVFSSKVYDILP